MAALKITVTILISFVVLSCGQNATKDKTTESILVPTPEGSKKDTFILANNDTETQDRWNFNKYLTDPQTPQLAKDIFYNNWKLKDDEPLEFLDRLTDQDKQVRPFYFKVVTNSYKIADGAFAEGLGNTGYEYVKHNPKEFSSYFIGPNSFTNDDLKTWADIVILEFGIIGEGEYDKPLVKQYLETVKKNCEDCSEEQKMVLERFSDHMTDKWNKFLKFIDK